MKRILVIVLAVVMVMTVCIGTALAKSDKSNGKGGDKGKPETTAETKKAAQDTKKAEQEAKKAARESFKTAVTPYLNKIKENNRAWGQAGGLDRLEGIHDSIEDMLQKVLAGSIVITPEQLAAISAEVQAIKTYKASLRADKRTQQVEWKKYIAAKKTYDIAAATAALQNVINIQLKRIEARKGIFVSLSKIAAILKEALAAPPVPSPSPEPTPSVTPSPEPSPSPAV